MRRKGGNKKNATNAWRVTSQERWQHDREDLQYGEIMAKAPPCPERSMRTPLPQQSEGHASPLRIAAKRMLRYLEDSEDLKVSAGELKGQLEAPEEEGLSVM